MVNEGIKIRAQIDNEAVRNVMLVNGGGSVALIALLPNILYTPLVFAVLATLSIWLAGLTLAVIHSILRRKCSLIHERYKMSPPKGRPKFGIAPGVPWVCWWSWKALYVSIAAFLLGGVLMVALGFSSLDQLTSGPHNKEHQSTADLPAQNDVSAIRE